MALQESILAHSPSLAQRYGRTLADLEKRCRAAGQLQAKLLFLGPSLLLLCQPVLRRRCATIFLAFGEAQQMAKSMPMPILHIRAVQSRVESISRIRTDLIVSGFTVLDLASCGKLS